MNAINVKKLMDEALTIEEHEAKEVGALGFIARAMVQATMPHRQFDGNIYERQNGNYRLLMMDQPKIGIPYGTYPRV